MDSDAPTSWAWQKKKQPSGKPARSAFLFALPHSRHKCTRACFSASVLIRVIGGLKLFFPVAAPLRAPRGVGWVDKIMDSKIIFLGEFNHGFLGWTRMIPASWDWQKKAKRDKYYNIFSNDFAAHDFAIPFSSIILSSIILSEKIAG